MFEIIVHLVWLQRVRLNLRVIREAELALVDAVLVGFLQLCQNVILLVLIVLEGGQRVLELAEREWLLFQLLHVGPESLHIRKNMAIL